MGESCFGCGQSASLRVKPNRLLPAGPKLRPNETVQLWGGRAQDSERAVGPNGQLRARVLVSMLILAQLGCEPEEEAEAAKGWNCGHLSARHNLKVKACAARK